FFFFSSRRRHTRWPRDWSSDVCSSDLDWRQVVALYDRLLRIHPSPVVQLNRAVAIAMRDGPEAGLTHIDAVLEHGELANYYLAQDRKSTRLNSSHVAISYAVFCLKKKK